MSDTQILVGTAIIATALTCWFSAWRMLKREVRRAYNDGYAAGLAKAAEQHRRNVREALGLADGVISIPPSGTRPS